MIFLFEHVDLTYLYMLKPIPLPTIHIISFMAYKHKLTMNVLCQTSVRLSITHYYNDRILSIPACHPHI